MSRHFEIFLGAPKASDLRHNKVEEHGEAHWRWETISGSLSSLTDEPTELVRRKDGGSSKNADEHSTSNVHRSSSSLQNKSVNITPNLSRTSPSVKSDHSPRNDLTHFSTSIFAAPATQPEWLIPPATLEAANSRLSLLYQNVIFKDDEDEGDAEQEVERDISSRMLDESKEGSTVISWPPTEPLPRRDMSSTSILTRSSSRLLQGHSSGIHTQPNTFDSQVETQETSYSYSDTSSITRFPTFRINLNTLISLHELTHSTPSTLALLFRRPANPHAFGGGYGQQGQQKFNIVAAILDIETGGGGSGVDMIRLKRGPDAGNEVAIMKMIIGDETDGVCRLTAWREVAEAWGGEDEESLGTQKGDVVLIENVSASFYTPTTDSNTVSTSSGAAKLTLTASPYLKSRLQICYRTMPTDSKQDKLLRPDLRIGASDPGVRKVGAVVQWLLEVAGI